MRLFLLFLLVHALLSVVLVSALARCHIKKHRRTPKPVTFHGHKKLWGGHKPKPKPKPKPKARFQKTLCGCHYSYNPVCGENGKTYMNACLAGCDKSFALGYVVIKHQGVCKRGDKVEPHSKPKRKPNHKQRGLLRNKPRCRKERDIKTDEAVMNNLQPLLKIDNDLKYSEKDFKDPEKDLQNAEKDFKDPEIDFKNLEENSKNADKDLKKPKEDLEDCGCSKEYNPVCGKDGRSYINVCVALCSQEKMAIDDAVAYEGLCVEDTT